ncbi:MAG: hypothetical protein V4773_27615 [Verrucomicrobiota bacterium]
MSGAEKSRRVDLGLELLAMLAKPGVALTHEDIAAWCGCTRGGIWALEKEAMKKLRNRLMFGKARRVGTEIQ